MGNNNGHEAKTSSVCFFINEWQIITFSLRLKPAGDFITTYLLTLKCLFHYEKNP